MEKRILTNQEQQSRQKKEKIYETAMELFEQYGYEQTTIRQICSAAGITTGSFYHFFQDKLGIIRYFYQNLQEVGIEYLKPTQENLSQPFQSIYQYFCKSISIWERFRPDVAQQLFMVSTKLMTGAYDTPYEETSMARLITFLQEAQKYGTVKPGLDAMDMALSLTSCATGCTYFWLLRYRNMSYEEMANIVLTPVFSALEEKAYRPDEG